MAKSSLLLGLRDAVDIAMRARNPWEAARAVLPSRFRPIEVLNDSRQAGGEASGAAELARRLRMVRAQLKGDSIVNGRVNYAAMGASEAYAELARMTALLATLDLTELATDAEKIAFFINIYNVLAIDGVVVVGIKKSVMEVPSFFGTIAYRIGGHVLTLDDIENGVLRCNGPHPATRRPLFAPDDRRLALCPSRVDPRIHSALVCASTSCPPFAFYDAERLDAQLDLATEGYVEGDIRVRDDARVVDIPITFHYYASDWGDAAAIYAFLIGHATGVLRDALVRARDAQYDFEYQRYDWSLNSVA
jgi:hypothetical protein